MKILPPYTGWLAVSLFVVAGAGCSEPELSPSRVIGEALMERSQQPAPESAMCAECHAEIVAEWIDSQHANANRLVSPGMDEASFTPDRSLHHGSFVTRMHQPRPGVFEFIAAFSNEAPTRHVSEAVIGVEPLIQHLVPFPGGRLQVVDVSYDPRSNDWFHVQGDENRQPHEWGFWKNRSMTWNVQCAFCHMTGFQKNYNQETDSYDSSWQAMGISCAQCHETPHTSEQLDRFRAEGIKVNPTNTYSKSETVMDNCASCHSRREELFGTFKPGDLFHDHFRLTLPDQLGIYYADGQVREEDFEYGSFMMSRMGHKGVSCMDCHNPHSGKLILPAENNVLCMQCHTPPGNRGAAPIDVANHLFHKVGTPGGRCIDCHMPVTYYMVRDGRRDHGFTSPDPRLTIEHGIPNACNQCHDDQTPEWAESYVDQWYGTNMQRRARDRARVIARAYENDHEVGPELLTMATSEEIDAWRAALDGLLVPWSYQADVQEHLKADLSHPSPLVRSAAIRSLQDVPDSYDLLKPLRSDTSALVRIDAAWATLNPLERDAGSYQELKEYLYNISDQPGGALRNANFAMLEGRPLEAVSWAETMAEWDVSPASYHILGRFMHRNNNLEGSISNLTRAAVLADESADYSYALALVLAEAGQSGEALKWLEETVNRDPAFGRAWYNLGLAYAQAEELENAENALRRAARALPESPDALYALATVLVRLGQSDKAVEQAVRALQIDPAHEPSLGLLRQLQNAARP